MPVKRRGSKARAHRITPEAVEAYMANDYMALHRALDLAPYEPSPLSLSVTPLGIDPDTPPLPGDGTCWASAWPQAVELQRELMAAVAERGPADRRFGSTK